MIIRVFRVPVPISLLALLTFEIAVLYGCLIFSSYLFLDAGTTVYLFFDGGLGRISVAVAWFVLAMYYVDMYSDPIAESPIIATAQSLIQATGIALIAEALTSYVHRELRLPVRVMIPGAMAAGFTILAGRIIYSRYICRRIGIQTVLFVGINPIVAQILTRLEESPERGFRALGYIGEPLPDGDLTPGKYLGRIESLEEVALAADPDRIVVGMDERRHVLPVKQLLNLRFLGYVVEEAAALYESICGRVPVTALRPSTLIFTGELGPRPSVVQWHNILNFGYALAGVIFSVPLMLAIAAAIKLTSPGPVFYRQKRVGLNGKLFDVLKFRSLYENPPPSSEADWDTERDPRVTRVGRILRKLRLNELPQLLNVLLGDMAIVGPRPERPEYVQVFREQIPFYAQRLCLRPGITGWAQINYKHADTVEDTITKLEYDLYYIKYMSQSLDLYILFQTVKTVLLTRGAG